MKRNLSVIFLRIISLILTFAFGVIITRSLSVYDRGLYTEFITWSSIGSVLISYGLPVFILREGAKKRINVLTINSIVVGFLLIAIFSIFVLIYNSFTLLSLFIISYSSFLFFITFYRHYVLAKNKIMLFELALIIPILFSLIISSVVYFIDPSIFNINIWILICILGPLLYLFFFKFKFNFFKNNYHFINLKNIKKIFLKASPFFIVSVGGIFFAKAPYAYLSLIDATESLAFFGIAEIIPALFVSVCASLVSLNSYSIFSSSKKQHLKYITKTIFYISLLFVVGYIICIYFGKFILINIYGDEYYVSALILPVLFASSFFGILSNILLNGFISQSKTIYGTIPIFITVTFYIIIYLIGYELKIIELAYSSLILSIISLLIFCIIFFKIYLNKKIIN